MQNPQTWHIVYEYTSLVVKIFHFIPMATQGFGCMGLSAFYSSARDVTPEKAKAVIHHAVSHGKLTNILVCKRVKQQL